mmetsp:Transcript_34876/g.62774  ORF Transcript_34876/g.62774 Transcript_34876/m.62774 type:complete len:294 (-) Transcript_34876:3634-4515(-)
MNRQRITRLIARADESFPHHGIAGLLQLPVQFIMLSVAKGRVGTGAPCNLPGTTCRRTIGIALRVATDFGTANRKPQRFQARLAFLVLLLVDFVCSRPVEVIVERRETQGPFPFAGLFPEVFLLQCEIDAHVIHFYLGDECRDDGADAHDILCGFYVIVRQITKRNETRDVTFQLDLRSKVAILDNFARNLLTRTKRGIRLSREKLEQFLSARWLHGLSGIFKRKTKLPFHHGQLREPFSIAVLFDHLGKRFNVEFFDFITPTFYRDRHLGIPRADIEGRTVDSLPLGFRCKK